jgi:hypothetical protein
MPVGLGSDMGAGRTFSMRRVASSAYDAALVAGAPVSPEALLWLATAGGARALGLSESVGHLLPGYEGDIVAVDAPATADSPALIDALLFRHDAGRCGPRTCEDADCGTDMSKYSTGGYPVGPGQIVPVSPSRRVSGTFRAEVRAMYRLASFAAASVILVGSAVAFGQTPPVQTQPGMGPPASGQAPQRDSPSRRPGPGPSRGASLRRTAACRSAGPRSLSRTPTRWNREGRRRTSMGRYEFTELAAASIECRPRRAST